MSFTQKLKQVIFDQYRYRKIRQRIPDPAYARFIQRNWVNDQELEWDRERNSLRVKGIDLELTLDRDAFLLVPQNQATEMLLLQKELGARFYREKNELFVNIDGLVLNIQTAEELLIIREVYLEGIYRYVPKTEYIVLDIGMNVGFSSLYFARDPLCRKVFGFEPFGPTYSQALKNFESNPSLLDKIVPLKYGLSDLNEEPELEYVASSRGSMSAVYRPEALGDGKDAERIKIQIRDVKEVFAELGINGQNSSVVAKIDCEGAEYAIINRLQESGLLSAIDVIMMEWHLEGAEPLIEKMSAAGFESFSLKPFDKYQGKFGFIYAIRKGNGK